MAGRDCCGSYKLLSTQGPFEREKSDVSSPAKSPMRERSYTGSLVNKMDVFVWLSRCSGRKPCGFCGSSKADVRWFFHKAM